MAAAWVLFATPAPAQDAKGMAQNGASTASTAQEERTGVSRPDPAVIQADAYNDSDDAASSAPAVEIVLPAKPSAAIPVAAPATTPSTALNHRATAAKFVTPAVGSEGVAASGKDAAAFDPDANIVTEETAGQADRLLLSGTGDEAAKENSDAGIVTRVASRPGEVPDGTLVKVKLMEELSTLTTKAGTSFSAEVSEPVMRDGQVVVPAGALEGRVTFVRGGKRVGASAAIHLEARTITLPDGSQYGLRARVIDTNSWGDTKVDSEGTILRKDHSKATATTVGISTGGGMAAGAVVGGLPGAVIGAGVGAGVSTAVWMRQDRQADLPKDLGVVFCLTEPMRVTPMSARLTRPGAGSAGTE
jgi:hypothetical protein